MIFLPSGIPALNYSDVSVPLAAEPAAISIMYNTSLQNRYYLTEDCKQKPRDFIWQFSLLSCWHKCHSCPCLPTAEQKQAHFACQCPLFTQLAVPPALICTRGLLDSLTVLKDMKIISKGYTDTITTCRRRHKQELSREAGNPHGLDAARKGQRAVIFCDWLVATFGRYLCCPALSHGLACLCSTSDFSSRLAASTYTQSKACTLSGPIDTSFQGDLHNRHLFQSIAVV